MLCWLAKSFSQLNMSNAFFFGDWQVEPAANTVRCGKQVYQLEPKAMDVLLLLCRHAGEVLSSDDIASKCWPGTDTGDNPLHKIITQLRKALGDNATNPVYIETIRKRVPVLCDLKPSGQFLTVDLHRRDHFRIDG